MTLKTGDWVTQYSRGFWQVVGIKPKYAEEDDVSYSKGDLIGYWALLKKGFTPKMKFMLSSDVCDAECCKQVDSSVLKGIEKFFAENPEMYEKLSAYEFVDRPAVSTSWLHLDDEQVEIFQQAVNDLPKYFTKEFAMDFFEKRGLKKCFSLPPSNYRFVCWHTLWELDGNFDAIYKNPELIKD